MIIQEIIDLHYNSLTFIMICVNLIFPIGLSQYGIVYQIMLLLNSPTINTFKARLDKFWENQDVRYNWKADISFTGSRSKVELTID